MTANYLPIVAKLLIAGLLFEKRPVAKRFGKKSAQKSAVLRRTCVSIEPSFTIFILSVCNIQGMNMANKQVTSVFVALLGASMLLSNATAVRAEAIEVVLDQAKVLQLPPNTTTVILGNPAIADVTMLRRNNQLILTGKAFGQTNMIALDPDGNSIGESTVRVSGSTHGLVVQRGMERETYSCAPRCQPTLSLGDNQQFLSTTINQARTRTGAARAR